MNPSLKFGLLGSIAASAASLGFFLVSRSAWADIGKPACLVVGTTAVIVVLGFAARVLGLSEMVEVAAIIAGAQVILYNFLAFTAFPGLAKGVVFLSLEHFEYVRELLGFFILAFVTAALGVWYVLNRVGKHMLRVPVGRRQGD